MLSDSKVAALPNACGLLEGFLFGSSYKYTRAFYREKINTVMVLYS